MSARPREAFVIGSGPNGLAAAIILAQAGLKTTVFEGEASIGGGTRSAELTLPGFVHDICSAVHPLGIASPVFASFPLERHGLKWIHPPLPLAHPLDDGSTAVLDRSLEATVQRLGADGTAYRRIVAPLLSGWPDLAREILAPLHVPKKPLLFARFGFFAGWPASAIAKLAFRTPAARALFAGIAAHSVTPLEDVASAAIGWVLAIAAHADGWPIPAGGSQHIADALAGYFKSLGGDISADTRIRSLDDLPREAIVLCDVSPRQLLEMAGDRFPARFRRQLERYRYGPGVFKLDWALSDPIPWKAHECARAATVHVGGTLEEVAASERAAWNGTIDERPFVLVVQPTLFDGSRAPAGKHTGWAYCHVPHASTADMTTPIEAQLERFAPGFRDTILARNKLFPADLERHNANLVGGNITGGAQTVRQLFLRPTAFFYRTPLPRVYLCSASTPPGGGVHGACGFHAARAALQDSGLL